MAPPPGESPQPAPHAAQTAGPLGTRAPTRPHSCRLRLRSRMRPCRHSAGPPVDSRLTSAQRRRQSRAVPPRMSALHEAPRHKKWHLRTDAWCRVCGRMHEGLALCMPPPSSLPSSKGVQAHLDQFAWLQRVGKPGSCAVSCAVATRASGVGYPPRPLLAFWLRKATMWVAVSAMRPGMLCYVVGAHACTLCGSGTAPVAIRAACASPARRVAARGSATGRSLLRRQRGGRSGRMGPACHVCAGSSALGNGAPGHDVWSLWHLTCCIHAGAGGMHR